MGELVTGLYRWREHVAEMAIVFSDYRKEHEAIFSADVLLDDTDMQELERLLQTNQYRIGYTWLFQESPRDEIAVRGVLNKETIRQNYPGYSCLGYLLFTRPVPHPNFIMKHDTSPNQTMADFLLEYQNDTGKITSTETNIVSVQNLSGEPVNT